MLGIFQTDIFQYIYSRLSLVVSELVNVRNVFFLQTVQEIHFQSIYHLFLIYIFHQIYLYPLKSFI